MGKGAFILFVFLILFSGVVIAQEFMTVETDIIVPESLIMIEVPDYVYVGNITWGFETEVISDKVNINNTGTVDVRVYPELVDPEEEIFRFLHFSELKNGPYKIIEDWDINISAPSQFGGVEKEYFYMKLDLEDYEGEFNESMLGHQTQIEFIAVEQ
ncbi:hypothetical protein CO038_02440 [Candidatus Pacearchaeota archaeon CG_4_9_14_0_2_um_filter_39_13]|nr:hypothetical protein [Candidatus Pacearchaeota archaeon]OIO43948.1 MAG: hypothetical protein AUJ64_01495 [Candidatus Pacearchaeota archaeon CG1_02_39_14]PJC44800.1 MAG: hypothetical protein CO038_02440 [Candidatus Pacearchaeota archaeon CG_4_9_14_0_2_um_filter_39_13]